MPPAQDNTARCILFGPRGFLMVQHSNCSEANRGKWGLPGGRLESGESARVTLCRELREELFVEVGNYVEIGRYRTKNRWHRAFAARLEEDVDQWDPSEIEVVRWCSLEEVEAMERTDLLHLTFEARAIRDFLAAVGSSSPDGGGG